MKAPVYVAAGKVELRDVPVDAGRPGAARIRTALEASDHIYRAVIPIDSGYLGR